MNDISVLLSLTPKVVFERSHPLMDLVSGHGPFVFYDQLSLERFPMERGEQGRHAEQMLGKLRSLLENRRLSFEDSGGTIRLFILLDLEGRFLHPTGQNFCFPAQKVRRFKEMVAKVFQQSPLLLKRFAYTFIFLEDVDASDSRAPFYRTLAYEGCLGLAQEWLTSEDLEINPARDKFLSDLKSPNVEWTLRDQRVSSRYAAFRQFVVQKMAKVASSLAQTGTETAFREEVTKELDGLHTIGDIQALDFDALLHTAVSRQIGLRYASDADSAFVIFKQRTRTEVLRRTDELVLIAFLQMIGTVEDEDYGRLMGLLPHKMPKLFVIDAQTNLKSMNVQELVRLREVVGRCRQSLAKGGALRWNENMQVTFNQYSAKPTEPLEQDEHKEQNDEVAARREELLANFEDLRKIPFFFGQKTGDWSWYNQMATLLDEISAFEFKHDRPLYGAPRRITEKQMDVKSVKASYATLKLKLDELKKEKYGVEKLKNLKEYLDEREEALRTFDDLKEQAKREMVKLGFAAVTYRLAALGGLAIVVCYALHFMKSDNSDSPWWIGVALALVCLCLLLGALFAQARIRTSIAAIFNHLFLTLTRQLHDRQEEYRKSINERISQQNEADVRKRNIDELQEKWNEYERHNLQAEIWYKHFELMQTKLDEMLLHVGQNYVPPTDEKPCAIEVNKADFHLDEMPAMPETLCKYFQQKQSQLSTGLTLNHITTFLTLLTVTEEAKTDLSL